MIASRAVTLAVATRRCGCFVISANWYHSVSDISGRAQAISMNNEGDGGTENHNPTPVYSQRMSADTHRENMGDKWVLSELINFANTLSPNPIPISHELLISLIL